MSSKITTTWVDNMTFDAEISGYHILMDADPEWGGEDRGTRPKPLLLAALSGCSGLDAVSILKKMQITNYQFHMDLEADSTSEHPIVYHTIRFNFYF
ncbi:MAG: OsmC family protein [Candidatus Cloacimonadaceae bacterium]|nr:OsmC family protein [Candidatus Cloacimonadaceae bacterium]